MWSRLKKRVWQGARTRLYWLKASELAGRRGFEFRHVQLIIIFFATLLRRRGDCLYICLGRYLFAKVVVTQKSASPRRAMFESLPRD